MPPRIDRRTFIGTGLAAAAVWPLAGTVRAAGFTSDPFSLGVASGCPTPDGVVLWTRLVFADAEPLLADPFAVVEKPQHPPMDVAWEIADDEAFRRPVRSGIARATADFAHSVHVEVHGLESDRWYFYRFRCGNALSRTGRTRTAPAHDAQNSRFSLAFASCQQYEQGWYTAYRDMAQRDLDLVIHLGDYIYELSYGTGLVRSHGAGTPSLLFEYRDRYALYKSDTDLQDAHAMFPWLVTWDDHEVVNDYGGDLSPTDRNAASFLRRRAAAFQAWYEHMPVPPLARPDFSDLRIYGQFRFGNLVDVTMLDTRQYRSPAPGAPRTEATHYTMLGERQEQWFGERMQAPTAQWSIIGQTTLLSERDLEPGAGERFVDDGWDGYRSARERLLNDIRKGQVRNPLVIGGDLHAFYAADVHTDDGDQVATEFVTGSITSNPPPQSSIEAAMAKNPHIRFGDAVHHGYSILDIARSQAKVELVAISDRKDPQAKAAKFQEFAVSDGRPGIEHSG